MSAVPADIGQLYNEAVAAHGQGNLPRAEQLYRQILSAEPTHIDALQMLGVLAAQRGQFDIAEPLFRQAVKGNPDAPSAQFNLGVALQATGKPEEALSCYDRAVVLQPSYVEAHYNRGVVLQDMMRAEDAIAAYDAVLALNPMSIETLSNRGAALQSLGRLDDALISYDRALAMRPGFVQTLHNRGGVLFDMGRPDDALVCYAQVLAQQPNNVEVLIDRGRVLHGVKRYEEAVTSYDRALSFRPGFPPALYNRALSLHALRKLPEALASIDRALGSAPNYVPALYGRGGILFDMKRFEDALGCYDTALALQPDYAMARHARAALLSMARRYEEAASDLTELLRLAPEIAYAKGELLHAKLNICDWNGLDETLASVTKDVRDGKRACQPFYFAVASGNAADQLQCARIYADDIYPASPDPVWKGERYAHDKIRVAYLSADFHEHATAALIAELFERHDRSKFEITGVSFGPDAPSEMRSRLTKSFDRFLDVRDKPDREVAQALRDLEIDIAVDLKGFGTDSREGILAQRPAPVQMNYLVFPGTLGAPYIDYILADSVLIPPGAEGDYSEKVVRLPDSYQINDSKRPIAAATPTRAEAGLPEKGFVFCCFNNNYKITPPVFDVWMRLLRENEGSVLWLLEGNDSVKRNLSAEAEKRGIAADRLVFAPRIDLADHLARHRLVDLFLDTLPCNAHTTASDALWAGLPVLTVTGTTFAGRVAASLLQAIGLPELVAESLAAYEDTARNLAKNPPALAALKGKLAANRTTTPLFDVDRSRRHIEAAYTAMAARAAAGEAPQAFDVPAV